MDPGLGRTVNQSKSIMHGLLQDGDKCLQESLLSIRRCQKIKEIIRAEGRYRVGSTIQDSNLRL